MHAVLCSTLLSWSAASALADEGPVSTRPFHRLFGQARDTERSRQSLDLTTTVSESYDDLLESPELVAGGGPAHGMSSVLQTAAKYVHHSRTFTLTMDSTGSLRYYPSLQREVARDVGASSTQSVRLGRRANLYFSETMMYEPFRTTTEIVEQTFTFDGVNPTPTVQVNDYTIETRTRIYTYNGVAGFSMAIARATLALGYEARRSEGDPTFNLNSQRAFVRFTQPMTRHASLRLGYGENEARFGGSDGAKAYDHDVDLGLDVDQPISASRKTAIRFGSGSSITTVNGANQLNLSGSAALRHEMGRTWTAQLQYRRGVQMLEGFAAPALTDTVGFQLDGSLTSRLRLTTSASGQLGTVMTAAEGRFARYDGSMMLSLDLSRRSTLVVRYLAQQYEPRSALTAALPLTQRSSGQGIRVGLTFWMDALR
jgi:hypothetical protein